MYKYINNGVTGHYSTGGHETHERMGRTGQGQKTQHTKPLTYRTGTVTLVQEHVIREWRQESGGLSG